MSPNIELKGQITKKLLKLLNIKFEVLSNKSNYANVINKLTDYSKRNSKSVAILIRKIHLLEKKIIEKKKKINFNKRNGTTNCIRKCSKSIPKISTTGMLSRELYEMNKKVKKEKILLCVLAEWVMLYLLHQV